MKRYIPLSALFLSLISAACFADRFPISQYPVIPKLPRAVCFWADGGRGFLLYCQANGFGTNAGSIDQTFLAMPLLSPQGAGYCPCTHEYLNGAAH